MRAKALSQRNEKFRISTPEPWIRPASLKMVKACDQIRETIALHGNMAAQFTGRRFAVATKYCVYNALVLVKRTLHAVSHPQLQTPVRPQTAMQRLALLLQESVVAGSVDGCMEGFVIVVVGVCIACFRGPGAADMGLCKASLVRFGITSCGMGTGHGLQLRHDFEHLIDAMRRGLHHDRPPARTNLDQANRTQLHERLANRSARDAELRGKLRFIQTLARGKIAADDSVFDLVAKPLDDVF